MSPRCCFAAALVAALAIGVPSAGATTKTRRNLTVLTRNLYLGADVITLATATDEATEQQHASQLLATLTQTNFPVRSTAIAKEIATYRPDVVALQEVATYRRGPDGVHDHMKDATTPVADWMALLQSALKKRGQHYRVAAHQTYDDVETGVAEGYDIRSTWGEAVLVRTGKGARVSHVKGFSGTFTDQLTVTLPDQVVHQTRGYAGIDGVVGGKRFRLIDPHPEAYSGDITGKELTELVRTAAKSRKRQTIIAGDLNSGPAVEGKTAGYKALTGAGFVDTGHSAFTCCQAEKLDNPVSQLDQWIDHIVARPRVKVLSSRVFGNRPADRISGLWPSDHAGVVAKIRLR
jgi:endonuclease/exonuclease/phosphatase family metal-dependent hydrolase